MAKARKNGSKELAAAVAVDAQEFPEITYNGTVHGVKPGTSIPLCVVWSERAAPELSAQIRSDLTDIKRVLRKRHYMPETKPEWMADGDGEKTIHPDEESGGLRVSFTHEEYDPTEEDFITDLHAAYCDMGVEI